MKIKSLVQTVALSAVASLMLIGCGGGTDSTPVDTTQTGTFVDAPVKGLHYKTATQDGYTNENGEFKYKAGETIEFKLGNLSLGSVTAGELITPYTIAGDTNISDPSDKATNIAMLLQSFDGNRSNTAMLDVSKLQDANLSDINISATVSAMTTKIANKFADNSFSQYRDTTNYSPVDATIAKNAMKTYVANLTNEYSVEYGFNEKWLKGKTLWLVDAAYGQELKDKTSITFNNGTYSFWDVTRTYEIILDGIIKQTTGNEITYYKIKAVDGSKIDICEKSDLTQWNNCGGNTMRWFFTNEADANTHFDTL